MFSLISRSAPARPPSSTFYRNHLVAGCVQKNIAAAMLQTFIDLQIEKVDFFYRFTAGFQDNAPP